MTRTLTITAAEWASVTDGRLWLVRDGRSLDRCDHKYYTCAEVGCDGSGVSYPPAEFVQACAPCINCGNERATCRCAPAPVRHVADCGTFGPCPDCRIELVGPCPCDECAESPNGPFTLILGRAYPVGEPLLIKPHWKGQREPSCIHDTNQPGGMCIVCRGGSEVKEWHLLNSNRLAHYGPPESLVGKWAVELVVQS